MRWYIIGRKTFYRARAVLIIFLTAVLLFVFSFSFVNERYSDSFLVDATLAVEEKMIIIDAGHGGEDSGAIGACGVLEKDLNLEIATEVGNALKEKGYIVLYTRTEDKLLYTEEENIKGIRKISDLKNRCKIANEHPGAIFVSIHMNSYSSSKYSGLQVYYTEDDEKSAALAGKIQSSVRTLLQNDNRRTTKCGKDIYILDNTEPVAVLIECGFLTNAAECKKLSEKEYQKQLSSAIVCGIIEYKEGK